MAQVLQVHLLFLMPFDSCQELLCYLEDGICLYLASFDYLKTIS